MTTALTRAGMGKMRKIDEIISLLEDVGEQLHDIEESYAEGMSVSFLMNSIGHEGDRVNSALDMLRQLQTPTGIFVDWILTWALADGDPLDAESERDAGEAIGAMIQAGSLSDEDAERVQFFAMRLTGFEPVGAIETLSAYETMMRATLPPLDEREMVKMASMGLAGEAGELVDMLKKHVYHGIPLDIEGVRSECGDVLWYLVCLIVAIGLDFQEVARANIAKLKRRYPDGFEDGGGVR